MGASNYKPTQLILATLITFFLLLLNKVNSFDDLSFSFNKFAPDGKDLLFQGTASVSPTEVLRITKVENGKPTFYTAGRARYSAPVHIWDSTTGQVASFSTSFSFVMKVPNGITPASGLAFFLAPPDAKIGGPARLLGLFENKDYNVSNQIVAVEFDTFFDDPWDPSFQHIGIDVNSITSIKTVKWDQRSDEVAIVTIAYLAPTKTLSISLIYPSDHASYIVSALVDLKAILPEWVRVGFSASTGPTQAETHDILNWNFASTFEDNIYVAEENNMHVARNDA